MNFKFTPEQETFRQEVRAFFLQEAELAKGMREEMHTGDGFGPATWAMLKKTGEKGWLCPTWSKEYGGLELPFMYRYIIMEEMHYHLNLMGTVGAGMAGPVIINHGSEEQKKKFLLPIARGEMEFVLGYTEPEAGSDLASLQIRAEDKGDYFLMNGQKMFNTRAHYTQYHWLGARTEETDPNYKGISLFVVDLSLPGISLTPYRTVGGTRTNGVFYDNVEVPKESLVGQVNKGFYYILEALAYERICTVAGLDRSFETLLEYMNDKKLGRDPLMRQKIGELAVEIEAARLFALKVAWMLDNKTVPYYEAAMLKIQTSETEQKLVDAAMDIIGPYSQIKKGEKWAQIEGEFEWLYRESLEAIIVRGTSEIMRNIIAERGLGLPRG